LNLETLKLNFDMKIPNRVLHQTINLLVLIVTLAACRQTFAQTPATTLVIDLAQPGKAISPDLFGVFFEDLNYAADGGLYAELIQNRSFEYQATEQPTWNSLTSWELVTRGNGKGSIVIDAAYPIHPNNPHYAVLQVTQPGEGVGLINAGFDGIPIKAGESYNVSLFARRLYTGNRWSPAPAGKDVSLSAPQREGQSRPLIVRLESKDGEILGEASLEMPGKEWTHLTATITANRTDEAARFVILMNAKGGLGLDVISLFPKKSFLGRSNGLRADLAQVIADLKPKFMRFPGGCLAHGNGLGNMYRWKDTIGPIEHRKEQSNLWGYHQTVGLGYFEYFQFCEDIGAKPLPVVAAGVCCQNSGYTGGTGQNGLPLEQMANYIQEILDLIEWANGPETSTWGAKRAAAGHPKSFNLEYLGVGNEDAQTDVFRERFKMIYDAVKAKHPEITVIGTVGPNPSGADYEAGWKFANEQHLEMVDEHSYKPPQWFFQNLTRFDAYDRAKSKVYLGEYAAHDTGRTNTLRSALAEAAYMTSLERNGDIVRLASYAPLLAKQGHMQWKPDMIYFNNTNIVRTANYYVQQMFAQNQGDVYLTNKVTDDSSPSADTAKSDGGAKPDFAVSLVRDSRTGDLIIKLVNASSASRPLRVDLSGEKNISGKAIKTVLTGDLLGANSFDNPISIAPQTSTIEAGRSFDYEAPAHSLTVIRIKTL
jgi:alpha-N-arabinofuranosidase